VYPNASPPHYVFSVSAQLVTLFALPNKARYLTDKCLNQQDLPGDAS
jgi:hypothetical protein